MSIIVYNSPGVNTHTSTHKQPAYQLHRPPDLKINSYGLISQCYKSKETQNKILASENAKDIGIATDNYKN